MKYKKRLKQGKLFPAFQFISVTDNCNLSCQGCWVTKSERASNLDLTIVDKIINESKLNSSYFFGILGGEPLMYKNLISVFEKHQDSYFQLFSNGVLLTQEIAEQIRKCANVTLLISLEGNETIADIRRGATGVYQRTLSAIDLSVKNGIITGVAISVCKSNIEMALSDEFIKLLHDKGVLYLWYYIYRPSGENPMYELSLSKEEIIRLRKFLVNGRKKYPIVLIDAYWDADGKPFCPAARGLSHHINSSGYIEPCPVIQFSTDNVTSGSISNLYENSVFLKNFRNEIATKTNGCILMNDPQWLDGFVCRNNAKNTSNRADINAKLKLAPIVCSHGECPIIPEKSWIYKIAKKNVFLGLGAYS